MIDTENVASNTNAMTSSNDDRFFLHWMSLQRTNLQELLHVLAAIPDGDLLRRLADKNIQQLHDYQQNRSGHLGGNALSIYSGARTCLENSLFWVGGFKPSIYIRLVEFIPEIGSESTQVKLIKALQTSTLLNEDKISSRMADLQECIPIEPLVVIAGNNNSDLDVDRVLTAHRVALGGIVMDADKLRVTVLKELIHILTPLQGIHLLVASNRLHLSIHEYGKK